MTRSKRITKLTLDDIGGKVVKDNETSSVRDKYTKADSLFSIDSESQIWFLQEIEQERYEIIFGDGVFG